MIISVQQVLFGEVNRGHGLLSSSLSENLLRSSVQLVTDLPGSAIPPNLQWEPYIRGYATGSYYVFSKTFPDPTASRPGMVFTNVLLFNLTELLQITDIGAILRLLPEKLDKSSNAPSLQIDITEPIPLKAVPPGYGKVVNTLLANPRRTVIWVGGQGFMQIVETLWANLWPSAREKFSFRISFAPQDIQENPPTIVCVPEALVSRWNHEPVVRNTDEYTPNPMEEMYLAQTFLLGLPEAEPIRKFQRDLNAFAPELTILPVLGRSFQHLQKIESGTENIDQVRDLVRSLARLSPSPNHGVAIKHKAITCLQALTSQGTAGDIRAVRNITLAPYANAISFFTETITAWMKHRLIVESEHNPGAVAELLEAAFSDLSSDWGQSINGNLTKMLANWNEQIANAVWQWWQQRSALVQQIVQYFPDLPIVEQTLVTKCPRKLSSQVGESVIVLSQDEKWFSLHAVVLLALFPPLIAIKKHLEFDRSPTFEDALRQLAKRLEAKTMLNVALEIGESRLFRLSGEICAKEPSFLSELDLNSKGWRVIWYESILVSKNPWRGVDDPSQVMNSVLSRVLQRLPIENNLLEKLGQTEYGDLTEYPERAAIWEHIPSTVATAFLEQTADGWLRRFSAKIQLDTNIEKPLKQSVLDSVRLTRYFQSNQSNLLSFTMQMFYAFTELSESQLLNFCLNTPSLLRSNITQFDAYQLGQLIKQRYWRRAATAVYQLVQWNSIYKLSDALSECYELLSWFDQGLLYMSGRLPEFKLKHEDWWTHFTELAIELYPSGPNEHELWTRSGGDKSIIRMSGNGREIWQDTMRKLKNGGGGEKISVSRMLKEMLNDYSSNQALKLLKKLLEKTDRY